MEADCGMRDVQMYVYKHNQAVRDDVVEDLLGLRETDRAMVVVTWTFQGFRLALITLVLSIIELLHALPGPSRCSPLQS